MKYSEIAVKIIMEAVILCLEEQIKFNILNFIKTIHLNELYLIESFFGTEFFGEQSMTFEQNPGQVKGLITATINGEVHKYVFNDKGYEPVEELLNLTRK